MKKHFKELVILGVIALACALILPNYFKENLTMAWPDAGIFITWFLVVFIVLSALFFSIVPKEKEAVVPDGYQTLYNTQNKLTQEGVFDRGQLLNGTKYFYNKNGSLSHKEIYKNGVAEKSV